jgi:hypothetical protein
METNDVPSMKDVISVQLYKHKWHRDKFLHCTKHHIHVVYYSRATVMRYILEGSFSKLRYLISLWFETIDQSRPIMPC